MDFAFAQQKEFVISIVMILIGAGFILYADVYRRKRRLMEDMPTSKIRSLAMGNVEVYGEVVTLFLDGLLISPFSNTPCVYYKCKVQAKGKSLSKTKDLVNWRTIFTKQEARYFYLQDDTGKVLVNLKNAEIDLAEHEAFTLQVDSELPDHLCKFIADNKIDIKRILSANMAVRFVEEYIVASENIYIYGTAGDNPFVDEASSEKNSTDIMLQKGIDKSRFYVTSQKKKFVIWRYRVSAEICMFFGILLVIAGIIYAGYKFI